MMLVQIKHGDTLIWEYSIDNEFMYDDKRQIHLPDPWIFESNKRVLLLDSDIKIMDDTYSEDSLEKKVVLIKTPIDLETTGSKSEFETLADKIVDILTSSDNQISVVGNFGGTDVVEFHIYGIKYQQLVGSISATDNSLDNKEPTFEETIHLYTKEFHRKGIYIHEEYKD